MDCPDQPLIIDSITITQSCDGEIIEFLMDSTYSVIASRQVESIEVSDNFHPLLGLTTDDIQLESILTSNIDGYLDSVLNVASHNGCVLKNIGNWG